MKHSIIFSLTLFSLSCINTLEQKPIQMPQAQAGSDTTVSINDTIYLHGTGIAPDGFIIKYEWKFDSSAWLATSTGDTILIAPENAQAYTCLFRVTDNNNSTGTDTVHINVVKNVPIAEISAPDSVVALTPFVVNAKQSSPGAFCKKLKYEWSFCSDNNFIEGSGNDTLILLCTGDKYPTYYVVILKVTDEDNNIAYDTQFVYRKKGWHILKEFNGNIVNVIVDSKGNVFVHTIDDSMTTISKNTGVDWLAVGKPGFCSKSGRFYIDKNDNLFTIEMTNGIDGCVLNFWRFDGNDWVKTSNYSNMGGCKILFDNNGIPVLTGFDQNAKNIFLCKLTGSYWVRENLNTAEVNSGINAVCDFAIDRNNKPYISCTYATYDTIYTFTKNDTTWDVVEKFVKPLRGGNTTYPCANVHLFFDNNNVMYNCYWWGYPGSYYDTYFKIGRKTTTNWESIYESSASRWTTECQSIGFDEENNYYFYSIENAGSFLNKLSGSNKTVIDNEINNVNNSSGTNITSYRLKNSNLLWISHHYVNPQNVIFHIYDGIKKTEFNVTGVLNSDCINGTFAVDVDFKDVMYMSSGNQICMYK